MSVRERETNYLVSAKNREISRILVRSVSIGVIASDDIMSRD